MPIHEEGREEQNRQQQRREEEQKRKNLELAQLDELQKEELFRQQQQTPREAEIIFNKDKPASERIAEAYNEFVKDKKAKGETADWEGKHNITDKSALSNAVKLGLTILGIALGLVLFSVAMMGMPLVAIAAAPIVFGGLYAANKLIQNKMSPANDQSIWCKEQRELVTQADLPKIITDLTNENASCKTKDYARVEDNLAELAGIKKAMENNYMPAHELRDKLLKASEHIKECEVLIKRNQNLISEMEEFKKAIGDLPAHLCKNVNEKYSELAERLDKDTANVATYQEAGTAAREIRDMLISIQATLSAPLQVISPAQPTTPKKVTPSAPSMTDVLTQRIQQDTLDNGVTISTSPRPN